MKPLHYQYLLASIFILLGGWCLLFPTTVETLVFKPEYISGTPTSALLIGCFGAQAVLGGIVMATSKFSEKTFLTFGIFGSVPFFIFNYYFYFIEEMFTHWMLLDFAGNIGILVVCILGFYSLNKGNKRSHDQSIEK